MVPVSHHLLFGFVGMMVNQWDGYNANDDADDDGGDNGNDILASFNFSHYKKTSSIFILMLFIAILAGCKAILWIKARLQTII
jgi:hypothetical protein